MQRSLLRTAFGFGCLATIMFMMAMMATPTQISRADDTPTEPIALVCSDSNGQQCTNNSSTDPTDCSADTKDKVCDKKDNKCVCRFSKVKLDCTCGYVQ